MPDSWDGSASRERIEPYYTEPFFGQKLTWQLGRYIIERTPKLATSNDRVVLRGWGSLVHEYAGIVGANRMSRLLDHMKKDWEIVLDLLTFYHECCYNCQPWENGECFWLSEEHDILDVLQEIVEGVCLANNKRIPKYLNDQTVAEAFDECATTCDNCGTEWDSGSQIGGSWLVCRGEDTAHANYLLTKSHWNFLTHYTKPANGMSGLEILLDIVWDKKIRGSNRMIVDKRNVVAFTECSPLEIMALLEGENHPQPAERFRWSRSRHGVALNRSALCTAGALPAIHGDGKILNCLPENQRFRYQKFDRTSTFSDWTFEREFRVEGNVNLADFKPCEVILIVANRQEMFSVLAQKKVPPFPFMPFDYVFSTDAPYARLTRRQKDLIAGGHFPEF